jgi:hypothetical protein
MVGEKGMDVVDSRGMNDSALAAKMLKSEGKEKETVASSNESLDKAMLWFFLKYQLGEVDYNSDVGIFIHWMCVLFILLFQCWSCHQWGGVPQSCLDG